MFAVVGLINALSVPITILNMIGGIVAGVWLAILGEWGTIGYGVGALFLSVPFLAILLMPSLALSVPSSYFLEKGNKPLAYFFAFFSNLYVDALIVIWCMAVLINFTSRADHSSFIPILIWSYGVATGPWTYMASKEGPDSIGSFIGSFFASFGYIVVGLMLVFMKTNIIELLTVFGVIMMVGLIIQFKLAIQIDKEFSGEY